MGWDAVQAAGPPAHLAYGLASVLLRYSHGGAIELGAQKCPQSRTILTPPHSPPLKLLNETSGVGLLLAAPLQVVKSCEKLRKSSSTIRFFFFSFARACVRARVHC